MQICIAITTFLVGTPDAQSIALAPQQASFTLIVVQEVRLQ
jgi:hypothetical protein